MAARYVCPIDGLDYPDQYEFNEHAIISHGHDPEGRSCRCATCSYDPHGGTKHRVYEEN